MVPTADQPLSALQVFLSSITCIVLQLHVNEAMSQLAHTGPWLPYAFLSFLFFRPVHRTAFLKALSIHPLPSGFCSRSFLFFLNILPLPDVLFHPLGCKSLNWPFLNLFTDLSLEFLIHIITYHTSFTHMFQRHQKFNVIRIALSIFLPYRIHLQSCHLA